MSVGLLQQLSERPIDEMRPIVRHVLGTEVGAELAWSISVVGTSVGESTAGIFKVDGKAQTTEGEQSWSAVVKVLGTPKATFREFSVSAAQRELEIYRSGVVALEENRVRSPTCYAIEAVNDLHFIWLEDLSAAPQPPWLPEYFIQTAQHVGYFNGRWSGAELPDWSWLNKGGTRLNYRAPHQAQTIARLPELRENPIVGHALSPDVVRGLEHCWEHADELFDAIGESTHCLCHGDFHCRNIFPIPDTGRGSQTVAIDWAHPGVGFLGADVGLLLGAAVKWLDVPVDGLDKLVEPICDAYLTGLHESGWSGDEDRVRLAYLTCLGMEAIRIVGIIARTADSPNVEAKLNDMLGLSSEHIFDRWGQVMDHLLSYIDSALQLARRL